MKKVDKYEIIELIYKGMASQSYKAHDPILNRLVLLKILLPGLSSDTQWVKRFKREAVIQAKLRHPNIVTIYELGKGDNFYIASEYIQGITLKELIAKKRSLEQKTVGSMILEIISALRYAHKKGIVHRDLKPANILITKNNQVKLTDFGLAFVQGSGSITEEGFVLGTPAYMSPEQARGKDVDFRSDIFSLGVTIYEALSGKNPFKGETHADSISRVLNLKPEALSKVIPNITPGVSDIVSKMLIKDPRKRLSNLDELESVFESSVGLNVKKTGQWKSLLRYAILVVAVFTLCVILYNNHIHKQRKEKVIQSSVEAMSFRYITADSFSPKSIDLTPMEMEPTTEDIKEKEQFINVAFKVSPWANIFIDGDSIGTTPFGKDIKLKKGRHSILLKNPYFPTIIEDVVIMNPCSLNYNLEERCAFLDIKVNPWGIVYIDGELVDTTPLKGPIAVTLGEHMVEVKHSELGELMRKVTMDSTKLYQVSFDLKNK